MTNSAPVLVERTGHVAVLILNRPDKHNAISSAMAQELVRALDGLEADEDVRVIVLTGAGEKAFCAGADMAEAVALQESESPQRRDFAAQAAARLARVKKPVIAAVNGYAYGGGAVFAISTDIRIASQNARFRFVGASYGLSVGASQLPRLVGAPVAKELIFTARTVDADEALRIGLVNRVVPSAELMEAALAMAGQIAANSPEAVRAAKEVIDMATSAEEAARREMEHNQRLRASEDHRRRFREAAERVTGERE
jgi:enoyl-CoA hydratase